MQNLKGEVVVMHLTNKFKNAPNVQGLFESLLGTLKVHFKTILILPGKLDLFYFFFFFYNRACEENIFFLIRFYF